MKEHEECLQEGRFFHQGIILDYMQHNLIIYACMAMTNKLENYEGSLQGSNVFSIATVLDPQLKLKANICQAVQEVQDEGNQAILHSIEKLCQI